MTTLTTQDPNIGHLDAFAAMPGRLGPDWFTATRRAAFSQFYSLGLPTVRHEDWRFTRITPIAETRFDLPAGGAELSDKQLRSADIRGLQKSELVFVNGQYREELSDLRHLPRGVIVARFADAWDKHRPLLEKHLARYADASGECCFVSLNTAMFTDGVIVFVPRNSVVDDPIHVINVAAPGDAAKYPLLFNPRMLIVAEQCAAVTIVEDYTCLDDTQTYFNNCVTEVVLGDNADVTHYFLERDSRASFNISHLQVTQGRDSRFSSHSVLLGGAIVRNNIVPELNGEGCWSQLNGVYVIGGEQAVDNHMRVIHAKPHGQSRQYYKGIMSDRAKGVFRGRIVVKPGAQKTDAVQSNQNLLLSSEASANSDPQLEIYADDVKCTHGSTTGQLADAGLFYLQARGIPEEVARAMMVYAFASESLERMNVKSIRKFLEAELLDRLPAGKELAASLA
jgi:Fe-S cluster assembly protein SufD